MARTRRSQRAARGGGRWRSSRTSRTRGRVGPRCSCARRLEIAVRAARDSYLTSLTSALRECLGRGPTCRETSCDVPTGRAPSSNTPSPAAADGPLSAERQGRKRPYLDEMNEFFDDSKCDATRVSPLRTLERLLTTFRDLKFSSLFELTKPAGHGSYSTRPVHACLN